MNHDAAAWAKLDEDRGYGAASGAGLLIGLIGGL